MAGKRKKPVEIDLVVVYKDGSGEFRWSARSSNGKKISDSGEGYKNRSYAMRVAKELFPAARVEYWGTA